MNILLDTNILVFLTRSKNFDDLINFINPQDALIYISVVTDAEIRSLALRKNWSVGRIELLENFISRINVIDVNQLLTQAYVDIDAIPNAKILILQAILLTRPATWVKTIYG